MTKEIELLKIVNEKQDELEKLQHLYYELNLEVERLKKELENLKEWQLADYWIAEGERRAMQRVKETILRLDKDFSKGGFQPTLRSLYRELGLGEEVVK